MTRPITSAFRILTLAAATIACGTAMVGDAFARSKPKAEAAAPGGGKIIGTFGDWGAYASSGKSKVCYALSQPTVREPKKLNRDPGYLFVSMRPADGVKNEVSWVLGFTAKDNAEAQAVVDGSSFAVITKGANGWVKNTAEEAQVVAAMAKGSKLVLKTQSARGNKLSDEFSLKGFTQALERARKECS